MEQQGTSAPLFEQALRDLVAAIAERKVEPICTAYLALRRQGHGMKVKDLLERVDRATDGQAVHVIVSAYSHRRCFMCEDGATRCKTCAGEGMVDRFPCPQCDGLGIEACSFCLGSGWIDRDEIPEEFRPAVLKRQAHHVEKDIDRLVQSGRKILASAEQMTQEERNRLAAWLIRLQARLTDLARHVKEDGEERAVRYGALAGRIDTILDTLRRKQAPPEANPED